MDNKYRFYEIMQAAEKGEDLSQFVPKNAPEAVLLADLLTIANGGGSADSIVPLPGPVTVRITKAAMETYTNSQIHSYGVQAIKDLIQQVMNDGYKVFINIPTVDNGQVASWNKTYISSSSELPVVLGTDGDTSCDYIIGNDGEVFGQVEETTMVALAVNFNNIALWGIEVPLNLTESKVYERMVYPNPDITYYLKLVINGEGVSDFSYGVTVSAPHAFGITITELS